MRNPSAKLNPANVSVMLLAAGRGKRMRELTKDLPKPLLKVGRYSLIEHHLLRLAELGFKSVTINIAYHANKIRTALGDGSRYGLTIDYSDESQLGALETAGGIRHALPLFKHPNVLVINADIWTDFDYRQLLSVSDSAPVWLVMVENPLHNRDGDFWIDATGLLSNKAGNNATRCTFSGIALYQTQLFGDLPQGKLALGPLLREWADNGQIRALQHRGTWADIGTPERLASLNKLDQT